MKLEDLIRKTSKEQNPRPNYLRLLRVENKVEAYERKKEEQQKPVPDRRPRKQDCSRSAFFKEKLQRAERAATDSSPAEEYSRTTTPFEQIEKEIICNSVE